MLRLATIAVIAAGCGGGAAPPPTDAAAPPVEAIADAAVTAAIPAPIDAAPTPVPPPVPTRRWIAGDLHMHTSPPGARGDQEMSIRQIAAAARARGLEFVIMTPHLWDKGWRAKYWHLRWQREWRVMADKVRAQPGITMIPGVEYGEHDVGHFGISGIEADQLTGKNFLKLAHQAGAFVVINHPFVTPNPKPGSRISRADLSYKPWTRNARNDRSNRNSMIDAVEVENLLLPAKAREVRALAAADRLARAESRPIAIVSGTDNHKQRVVPTTWVLATDASEPAILAGLRAGATCIGGPEAGSLEAHGDADPGERWAVIGESARASASLELRWRGLAQLFVDGVDRGRHDGGWIDTDAGGVHTYRIEIGKSRCGFVYANLE